RSGDADTGLASARAVAFAGPEADCNLVSGADRGGGSGGDNGEDNAGDRGLDPGRLGGLSDPSALPDSISVMSDGIDACGPVTDSVPAFDVRDPSPAAPGPTAPLRSTEAISPSSFKPSEPRSCIWTQRRPGPLTKAPPRNAAPTRTMTRTTWRTLAA